MAAADRPIMEAPNSGQTTPAVHQDLCARSRSRLPGQKQNPQMRSSAAAVAETAVTEPTDDEEISVDSYPPQLRMSAADRSIVQSPNNCLKERLRSKCQRTPAPAVREELSSRSHSRRPRQTQRNQMRSQSPHAAVFAEKTPTEPTIDEEIAVDSPPPKLLMPEAEESIFEDNNCLSERVSSNGKTPPVTTSLVENPTVRPRSPDPVPLEVHVKDITKTNEQAARLPQQNQAYERQEGGSTVTKIKSLRPQQPVTAINLENLDKVCVNQEHVDEPSSQIQHVLSCLENYIGLPKVRVAGPTGTAADPVENQHKSLSQDEKSPIYNNISGNASLGSVNNFSGISGNLHITYNIMLPQPATISTPLAPAHPPN